MCYPPDAMVPPPPGGGNLGETIRLVLSAADGNDVAAFFASTRPDAKAQVLVLPDVRGLHAFYERLAESLADAGYNALAIDIYGRSAGCSYRDDGFAFREHVGLLDDNGLDADVDAALVYLRDVSQAPIYVLGFCFTGRTALLQATRSEVAGVISFYGQPARQLEPGGPSPLEDARSGRVCRPVLAFFGGADPKIPPGDVSAYSRALAERGVGHKIVTYPGAPHGFFDHRFDEHREACDDAWQRLIEFFGGAR